LSGKGGIMRSVFAPGGGLSSYKKAPQKETRSNDLLFCPFCGSKEVSLSKSVQNNEEKTEHYFIECEKCAACGPEKLIKYQAAKHWNIRAK
jgi:Lar family restriction alleviation protein